MIWFTWWRIGHIPDPRLCVWLVEPYDYDQTGVSTKPQVNALYVIFFANRAKRETRRDKRAIGGHVVVVVVSALTAQQDSSMQDGGNCHE